MELGRKKGLGRGLGAILGEIKHDSEMVFVHPDQVRTNPYQPRTMFAEDEIRTLAESIKQNGVLQPLVVSRKPDGFQLIAGERRLRAAKMAGLDRVPVVVREADERDDLLLALVENLQREDLNPLDAAQAYKRLADEFGLTQEEIARRIGKSRAAVANAIRLLSLPPAIQEEIRRGSLTEGHARALAGVSSREAQLQVAEEIRRRRLSVRDTEKLVRRLAARREPELRAIEERVQRALGTKVRVHLRPDGRGKIEIEFYSQAELEGLVERLTSEVREGRIPL
ncbi:MAG: chromosome partitioning protein ParB [Candidatus Binatia bacterium]|nr:MAG: chromosome partitioning protein ParB [Candidatus Binatia bacterium]